MKKALILPVAAVILMLSSCGGPSDTPTEAVDPDSAAAPPVSSTEPVVTKTGVAMVRIPAGSYQMGSEDGGDDETPVHEVRVDEFLMDVHEVTQAHFESLMGMNPAKFKNPDHPVEQLGWYGAIRYCNMRSLREGLEPCYDLDTAVCDFNANGYRLPTEAEWEYACRAGSTGPYSFGADERQLGAHAWYEANAGGQTQPVKQKTPNSWGLYDMHGNVWEWCQDLYSDSSYSAAATDNPCNMTDGEQRVLRGGGWESPPEFCRSSTRYSEDPGLADVCFGYEAYGFRCVRRDTEESNAGLGVSMSATPFGQRVTDRVISLQILARLPWHPGG